MNLRPLPMLIRASGLACSLLVVNSLPAQVVFSPSEIQITSTAGLVNVTSASGTKIANLQVPTASGEKPTTATHRPGAIIETGPDSQATVTIPGAGSMLLGSDTKVRLPKPGDKGQSLELLKGKLFLNISAEEVKKQGEASFRLKTPAALLAVKGTKFFASVEKAAETCGVHEGTIGSFAIASRQLNDVQSGNALNIVKGKPEPVRALTADERRDAINYELAVSEGRITNSLGMKFAAVPGTKVLFCIHETRIRDFMTYAKTIQTRGNNFEHLLNKKYGGFEVGEAREHHPVTGVLMQSVLDFCSWLGQKEGWTYRLPTDEEWSFAAGIGRLENRQPDTKPSDLDGKLADVYPWGKTWPPTRRAGNFCDESYHRLLRPADPYLAGYDDGFPTTAPVMSFPPNSLGLYDLGGNCWEHVLEADTPAAPQGGLFPGILSRGGSFLHSTREMLSACKRAPAWLGEGDVTFRVVLVRLD